MNRRREATLKFEDSEPKALVRLASLKPGASASVDELIDWRRVRLAAYKKPNQLEIVEELPNTVTGKILRRMLK